MALSFPSNPYQGQTATTGGRNWVFNGAEWVSVGALGYQGSLGFQGSSGYFGSSGYLGSVGFAGSAGIGYVGSLGYTGSKGDTGPSGSSTTTFSYHANTTSTANAYPGSGYFTYNSPSQISATGLYVSHYTSDAVPVDIDLYLGLLANQQPLIIQDITSSENNQHFLITATPKNYNPGTSNSYWFVPVSLVSAAGTGDTNFSQSTSLFLSVVYGATGATGYTGSIGSTGYTGSFGLTGYTGSQGVIGYTGSKGDSGYTGSTGFGGSFGLTGYTGSFGLTGYTGSIGYGGSFGLTGYTGSFGLTGYTGSFGLTGYTGSFGLTGYTGSQGNQGIQGNIGYTGSVGVTGFTGSQGTQGNDGYTGSKGAQGVSGYTGSQGNAGFTGSIGATGTTGYTGSQGIQGNSGYTGSTGQTGTTGFTGSQGFQGDFGYTGSKGDTGSQGNIGYTGSKGDSGYTGSQGSQGIQGSIGYSGSAGYQGSIGATGNTGYTGSQGNQGNTGYTGSKGDQGNNGYTGSIGTTGNTGYTGSKGDQGTQGYAGSAGTNGTNGVDGYNGSAGFTGSQGIQGYTGSAGTNGYNGSNGFTGSTGSQGYTGSIGPQGPQGNFGGETVDYIFNTSTSAANPGTGQVAFNNTNLSSASYLYINQNDNYGSNTFNFLLTIDASTSSIKGHFMIKDSANNADYAMFAITGSHSYSAPYLTVPVSYLSGATSFNASQNVILTFAVTGDRGDVGYTGSQGTTGFVGSQGTIGYTGSQGNIGYTGSQGTQGNIGYTGSTGSQGIAGYTGSQGAQGNNGYTGSIGASGYTGSIGATGNMGYTGSQGIQGVAGYIGSTGQTGAAGYTGSIGATGTTGYTGSQGNQGNIGYTGSIGIGYTGSTGTFASGQDIVAGNVTINGYLSANGSTGTRGQVLASNGAGGIYWTTDQVGNSVTANTVVTSTLAADSINIGVGYLTVGNATVNTVVTNTSIRTSSANILYLSANGVYGGNGQVLTSNSTGGIFWSNSLNSVIANDITTGTLAADSMNIGKGFLTVGNSTVNTQVTNSSIVVLSITANGSVGAAGSVLTSNGNGMYWSNAVATLQAQTITAGTLAADSMNIGAGWLTIGNSTVNTQITNTAVTTSIASIQTAYFTSDQSTPFNTYSTLLDSATPKAVNFAGVALNSGVGVGYTVEFFVKFNSISTGAQQAFGATNAGTLGWSANTSAISIYNSGYHSDTTTGWNLQSNVWYHFAYIGYNGQTYVAINGNVKSLNTPGGYSAYTATGTWAGGWTKLTGDATFSNFRVVTGRPIYNILGFVPPTQQLTPISGTQLLSLQSSTFTDVSGKSRSVTTNGTPTLAIDSISLSTGVLTIAGSIQNGILNTPAIYTNYLYANNAAGTADQFLVSNSVGGVYWASESIANTVSANSINATAIVTSTLNADSLNIGIGILSVGNSTVNTQVSNNGVFVSGNILASNSYNSATYASNAYIQTLGVRGYTGSIGIGYTGSTGYTGSIGASGYNGSIGIGYTGSTGAGYTGSIGGSGYTGSIGIAALNDSNWQSRTAIFDFEGTAGSTLAYEYRHGFSYPLTGGASLSSTQVKVGSTSLYLGSTSGSGNQKLSDVNFDSLGGGNFTVECWIYPTAFNNTTYPGIWDTRNTGTDTNGIGVFFTSGTNLNVRIAGTDHNFSLSTIGITVNTWTHLTIERVNSVITIYVNGTSVGTISDSTLYDRTTLWIGSTFDGYSMAGYIDNFRITSGIAVYNGNFTPSVSAYPLSQYNIIGSTTGFTGSSGNQGIIGYTGSIGSGYAGSTGYTGSQGTNGVIGYNGSVGYTGSAGFANGQSLQVQNLVVNGAISANGTNGVAGYILSSNGNGAFWSTPYTFLSNDYFQSAATGVSNNYVTNNIGSNSYNTATYVSNSYIQTVASGTSNSYITNNIVSNNYLNTLSFGGSSIGYTGSAGTANAISQSFTGDGNRSSFTITSSIKNQNNAIVSINGILQVPVTHYTIASTNLTFTSIPSNNSVIEIRNFENGTGGVGGSFSNGQSIAVANLTIGNTTSGSVSRQYVLYGNTYNTASETILTTDGTNSIPVPGNTTIYYTADIVGRGKDSATQTINYRTAIQIKGVVDNQNGTTTDVGNLYELIIARDVVGFSVDARANNAADTINIFATANTGYNVNWVALVTTVEVPY